jgi:hypothetical protein
MGYAAIQLEYGFLCALTSQVASWIVLGDAAQHAIGVYDDAGASAGADRATLSPGVLGGTPTCDANCDREPSGSAEV